MRIPNLIAGLILPALLGCSDTGHREEPVPGSFTTRILPDGTKLFTYVLRPPEPRRERPDSPGRRAERHQAPDGSSLRGAPRAGHRHLQELLEQNRYCRDGYVTLQQYTLYGGYTIRGECRDAATEEDRHRFPDMVPAG